MNPTLRIVTLVLSVFVFGTSYTPSDIDSINSEAFSYIDMYRDLAIAEMHRTGVPASITLAQGMHETSYGSSSLATKANNHFGIKCKKEWNGQTYYHKDDDLDTKGNLIESCFRAYNDAIESYVDHSNFLKYRKNYIWLFDLPRDDYKAWCYGLKNSHYATDPQYAVKLIRLIENYQLYHFDKMPRQ